MYLSLKKKKRMPPLINLLKLIQSLSILDFFSELQQSLLAGQHHQQLPFQLKNS